MLEPGWFDAPEASRTIFGTTFPSTTDILQRAYCVPTSFALGHGRSVVDVNAHCAANPTCLLARIYSAVAVRAAAAPLAAPPAATLPVAAALPIPPVTGNGRDGADTFSAAVSTTHDALAAAARARFEFSVDDDDGRPTATRMTTPKNIKGESHTDERGGKTMEGPMSIYGAHRRYSANDGEKVPERAQEWADRYNRNGPSNAAATAALAVVDKFSSSFSELERLVAPEAAVTRRAIAEDLDPDREFRVIAGDSESTAFSMSLTSGYVVSPHDDSGTALEFIVFIYPSDTPLPESHEWNFAVAGCIHPLPKKPGEIAIIGVRGSGVFHGTLPTSSTEPHLSNHPGVGSALVTKGDLVRVLRNQRMPDALPPPTPDELKKNAERVKCLGPVLKARDAVENALKAISCADVAAEAALSSASDAVGEGATPEARELEKRAVSVRQGLQQKALDDVLAQITASVQRLEAGDGGEAGPSGLPPLVGGHGDEEDSISEDEMGVYADVVTTGPEAEVATASPGNLKALLLEIANNDFGVIAGAVPVSIATPAMKAYNKACPLDQRVEHGPNTPLPDGFRVVMVRALLISPLDTL